MISRVLQSSASHPQSVIAKPRQFRDLIGIQDRRRRSVIFALKPDPCVEQLGQSSGFPSCKSVFNTNDQVLRRQPIITRHIAERFQRLFLGLRRATGRQTDRDEQ
jgi:hypothetical protein